MIAFYTLSSSYNLSPELLHSLKEVVLPEKRINRLRSILPNELKSSDVEFKGLCMSLIERIQAVFVLIKDFFLSFISQAASLRYYERWDQIKSKTWMIAIKNEAPVVDEVSALKTPFHSQNSAGQMPTASHKTPFKKAEPSAVFRSPIAKTPCYRPFASPGSVLASHQKLRRAASLERTPVSRLEKTTAIKRIRGESEERRVRISGPLLVPFLYEPSAVSSNKAFADFQALIEKNKGVEGFSKVASDTLLSIMSLVMPKRLYLKETIKTLLEAGADVNLCNSQNCSLLQWSVERGNADLVDILFQYPMLNVNGVDDQKRSLIHYALSHPIARGKILEKLIKTDDIDLNIQDKDGKTALHLAARFWRADLVQKLLDSNKVNVSLLDNEGNSVLHELVVYFSEQNNSETVRVKEEKFKKLVAALFEKKEIRDLYDLKNSKGRTVSEIVIELGFENFSNIMKETLAKHQTS